MAHNPVLKRPVPRIGMYNWLMTSMMIHCLVNHMITSPAQKFDIEFKSMTLKNIIVSKLPSIIYNVKIACVFF